jgi:hypothetical protein
MINIFSTKKKIMINSTIIVLLNCLPIICCPTCGCYPLKNIAVQSIVKRISTKWLHQTTLPSLLWLRLHGHRDLDSYKLFAPILENS